MLNVFSNVRVESSTIAESHACAGDPCDCAKYLLYTNSSVKTVR